MSQFHPEDVDLFGSAKDGFFHKWLMKSAKWFVNLFVFIVGIDTLRFMIPPLFQIFAPFFHLGSLVHETPDENVNHYIEDLDQLLMLSVGIVVTVGIYLTYVYIEKKGRIATVYDGLTSGAVKVKMASGLIGLSSVSLTGTFIKLDNEGMLDGHSFAWSVLGMKLAIHGALILGFVAMAVIERLTHPPVPHHAAAGQVTDNHELTESTGTELTHPGTAVVPAPDHDGHPVDVTK